MIALRIGVGLLAIAGVVVVLSSVMRTVVIPRAVPARLGRAAFLAVRRLLRVQLRVTGASDYETVDRVLALQAPLGIFAQLLTWSVLLFLCFAALFWALLPSHVNGPSLSRAIEVSGSSMLTLGFATPHGLVRQLAAFAAAGIGVTLLALVITYLPTLYAAFSRREALITKLSVRTGQPPSGPKLLSATWELGRFDQLEEVWDVWEDWFIEVGESHITFPQLAWFRSPRAHNHWVLAAESVLDGAALFITACAVPRQSRSELCLNAGVHTLISIADFRGIAHHPPSADPEIALPREKFDAALDELAGLGVPLQSDRDAAWNGFRRTRARYEPLIAVLGRLTYAPRSDWSPWSLALPLDTESLFASGRRPQ